VLSGLLKLLIFYMKQAGSNYRLQLNELDELRNEAYENAKIYEVKTKAFNDKMISCKSLEPNQKVWLFNSKFKLFPRKLRSRWDGPFVVQCVFPSGAVQILDPQDGRVLVVNGQHWKLVVTNEIAPGLIESINLVDPIYND